MFLLGMLVGIPVGVIGVIIVALCIGSKKAEEYAENLLTK